MKRKTRYHIFHGMKEENHYHFSSIKKARKKIRELKNKEYIICDKEIEYTKKGITKRIYRNDPKFYLNDIKA